MFIERFEGLGEFVDEDNEEARNTRLRICACLYYWLKNHPNDLIHRQTRQRVASFLRDRVALFPCLNEIYIKLLPLSSIHHFNSWRWPSSEQSNPVPSQQQQSQRPCNSRSSSFSSPSSITGSASASISLSSVSDEDTDPGFYDAVAAAATAATSAATLGSPASVHALTEKEMDEDREWGLFDEDDALPEAKKSSSIDILDSLASSHVTTAGAINNDSSTGISAVNHAAPQAHVYPRSTFNFNSGSHSVNHSRAPSRTSFPNLQRDRRSSTGSLVHSSPCTMEAFVANRRGSASSVSSVSTSGVGGAHGHSALSSESLPPLGFSEGDLTPQQHLLFQQQQLQKQHFHAQQSQEQQHQHQHLFQLQPMVSIPFIGRRSSSQAYRQKTGNQSTVSSPIGSAVSYIFKDNAPPGDDAAAYQQQSMDYLSMNTPFIEIKDAAIAAQLTCVEFGLFKKLKPRDMLRQVWKTSKGSAAFQACIAHFNFISSWVGTMILSPPKAKNRAKMMEKFINIAKILRDMGNFNTTMAIIGAMNTSSIHRLVQTRELLQGKEVWTTFKELEHLMSSERSFYEYRQALKIQKLPCIPYLGVHLGDLLSISEGNRDFRQDGTIHWQKFCLLTEVISTVMHFQSEPYSIHPDPFISRVITDTHVLDDEELYTKSVGTEPGKLHHSRSLSKFNFF
ncbi:hypothetical protein EDD11_008816 [Mortierella claussenii]|nr:hypothetical protein EDD11_008816 [Mortierella claussenii]